MRAIRIGVCALLAFAVLAHGAVEAWSEGVLEIGAVILLVVWGLLFALGFVPAVRWNWLLAPVAGLWLFAAMQYLLRLSAMPFLTRVEMMKFSSLAILFFLALQAFETLKEWQGFVWFCLVLGFVVSAFGIIQYFSFNGKLYWFRELRYGGIPFGPYVNRNHFAGFIELIVPTGLSMLILRADHRDRTPLLAVLTLLPIGALFLSASRGGISTFLLEAGLVIILAFLRHRGRSQIIAGATVLLLAGALVAWLGIGPALDRFASYRKLEISEQRRTEMLRDTWRIFVDHPVAGTGFGTLQAVFPHYESLYDGNAVIHSHNDYVETLAETGLVGGMLCAAFLFFLFRDGWKRMVRAPNSLDLAFHIGAFVACCGLLAHSLVDFNLHIPANALLFLLQAGLATSETRSGRAETANPTRYTSKSPVVITTGPV